jgi:hypothetical protein
VKMNKPDGEEKKEEVGAKIVTEPYTDLGCI